MFKRPWGTAAPEKDSSERLGDTEVLKVASAFEMLRSVVWDDPSKTELGVCVREGREEVKGAREGEVKTRLANEAEEPRQLESDEPTRPVERSEV